MIARLALPVGSYTSGGETKLEYRDVGTVWEFEGNSGQRWREIKLPLDVLNPTLAGLAKAAGEKTSGTARVKIFQVEPKRSTSSASSRQASDNDGAPDMAEDNIPF